MEYLVCAIAILIAYFAGVLVATGRMKKAVEEGSVGYLRIDRSEPDEPPRAFLEITKGSSIELISEKEFVMLKVVNENYLSLN